MDVFHTDFLRGGYWGDNKCSLELDGEQQVHICRED